MTYAMKLAAPLFLATLTTAQVAQAGSATGTMNVSGNVQGSCTVSAVALNFGAITPGSATDATSGYYTRRGKCRCAPYIIINTASASAILAGSINTAIVDTIKKVILRRRGQRTS